MTLEADEFLRRFLLHVLPASFVRIRYFGLLANRHRTQLLVGTSFDIGFNQSWEALSVGQMSFPKAGVYQFLLNHDDGCMIAFDPAMCTKVSGTVQNDAWSSRSPVLGFPWIAGNNNSTSNFASTQDLFSINVLADNSVIEFEIGYSLEQGSWAGVRSDLAPLSTHALNFRSGRS